MAYADFTFDDVTTRLGITTREGALFPDLSPVPVPTWLTDWLGRNTSLALANEKSRSESVIVPVLRAAVDGVPVQTAIYSGCRFDVDRDCALVGVCDYLLSVAPPLMPVRQPAITVVVAKQADIEDTLPECYAQMAAVARFGGVADRPAYGCVTSGEVWQFLRLDGAIAVQDRSRFYLCDVDRILAAFAFILGQFLPSG